MQYVEKDFWPFELILVVFLEFHSCLFRWWTSLKNHYSELFHRYFAGTCSRSGSSVGCWCESHVRWLCRAVRSARRCHCVQYHIPRKPAREKNGYLDLGGYMDTWGYMGTWGYMDTWYSNSKFRIWKELTDKKLNLKVYLHKVVEFCHHCLFQSFFNLECCKTLTFRPSWHLINNTMLSFNLIEQIFQIKISFFL